MGVVRSVAAHDATADARLHGDPQSAPHSGFGRSRLFVRPAGSTATRRKSRRDRFSPAIYGKTARSTATAAQLSLELGGHQFGQTAQQEGLNDPPSLTGSASSFILDASEDIGDDILETSEVQVLRGKAIRDAVVTRKRGDNTYEVLYPNGDHESHVAKRFIRLKGTKDEPIDMNQSRRPIVRTLDNNTPKHLPCTHLWLQETLSEAEPATSLTETNYALTPKRPLNKVKSSRVQRGSPRDAIERTPVPFRPVLGLTDQFATTSAKKVIVYPGSKSCSRVKDLAQKHAMGDFSEPKPISMEIAAVRNKAAAERAKGPDMARLQTAVFRRPAPLKSVRKQHTQPRRPEETTTELGLSVDVHSIF